HDLRIILRIRRRRRSVPQLAQVAVAPHVLDPGALLQRVGEDDHINGGAALVVDLRDRLEDLLMSVEVEILLAEDLNDVADAGVVAQHAAQRRALGVATLRGQTIQPFRRHDNPPRARSSGTPGQGAHHLRGELYQPPGSAASPYFGAPRTATLTWVSMS